MRVIAAPVVTFSALIWEVAKRNLQAKCVGDLCATKVKRQLLTVARRFQRIVVFLQA